VNDAVNVGVGSKHLVERSRVGDISLDELGPLAADQFNAVDDFDGRVVQVVCDDNLVASLEEGESREGADIARSSVGVRSGVKSLFVARELTR
jgi:hypothetical protein